MNLIIVRTELDILAHKAKHLSEGDMSERWRRAYHNLHDACDTLTLLLMRSELNPVGVENDAPEVN